MDQSMNISAKPTIMCGPSGVGKGTVFKLFQSKYPQTLSLCVSHTTRAPREGEVDGVHYHFVTKEQFLADEQSGKFLEVTHFADKSYGTSIQAVRDVIKRRQICLLEIHYTAAIKITNLLACNRIFVTTSGGSTTLKQRLKGRGTESAQQIDRRLKAAQQEFDFVESRPDFFDAIIYNDCDVEDTVDQLAHHLTKWYPNIMIGQNSNEDAQDKTRVQCTLM